VTIDILTAQGDIEREREFQIGDHPEEEMSQILAIRAQRVK
jgi:hypothetical protein